MARNAITGATEEFQLEKRGNPVPVLGLDSSTVKVKSFLSAVGSRIIGLTEKGLYLLYAGVVVAGNDINRIHFRPGDATVVATSTDPFIPIMNQSVGQIEPFVIKLLEGQTAISFLPGNGSSYGCFVALTRMV